jgi:hypothetical protein
MNRKRRFRPKDRRESLRGDAGCESKETGGRFEDEVDETGVALMPASGIGNTTNVRHMVEIVVVVEPRGANRAAGADAVAAVDFAGVRGKSQQAEDSGPEESFRVQQVSPHARRDNLD